jgi:hypothetical protein
MTRQNEAKIQALNSLIYDPFLKHFIKRNVVLTRYLESPMS